MEKYLYQVYGKDEQHSCQLQNVVTIALDKGIIPAFGICKSVFLPIAGPELARLPGASASVCSKEVSLARRNPARS